MSQPGADCSLTSQRKFLQKTVGLAAGAAVLSEPPLGTGAADGATLAAPLATIKLGPHEVTRLIVGGKPICGYSHFKNIKPTDAVIVGMYQQLTDEVGQNAATVRILCARRS